MLLLLRMRLRLLLVLVAVVILHGSKRFLVLMATVDVWVL
jgi:hypothetical protein